MATSVGPASTTVLLDEPAVAPGAASRDFTSLRVPATRRKLSSAVAPALAKPVAHSFSAFRQCRPAAHLHYMSSVLLVSSVLLGGLTVGGQCLG